MGRKYLVFLGIALALVLAAFAGLTYIQRAGEKAEQSDAELLDRGIALFREEQHEQAFEVLRQIRQGSPLEWRARYYQGSSLIMLKNYRSALTYLEQAYALNDRQTPVLHALGVAHYKLGDIKMAKAWFAAVLEIDPYDEEARGLMDIMARLERDSEPPHRPVVIEDEQTRP